MLLSTRPGHGRVCVRSRFGCTCFYYTYARGHRAKAVERRIARRVETRRWRREEAGLNAGGPD